MKEEQSFLEEAMDNLREALQRLRATQTEDLVCAGLSEHPNYRQLSASLSMAQPSAEAAYMEAHRRLLSRGS